MDTTNTSKPVDHMEQRLINVDETMQKGSEVAKQVDHTKVIKHFIAYAFGDNINGDSIPILEHVQSANVNVESHCKRPTLKSLEHQEIIALNV